MNSVSPTAQRALEPGAGDMYLVMPASSVPLPLLARPGLTARTNPESGTRNALRVPRVHTGAFRGGPGLRVSRKTRPGMAASL